MLDKQIGNYKIIRKIGAGGMAQVYLAVHKDVPNLKVVLKILSDPRLVERFRQEADKLALLDGNPHICQIKHFFNHGDEIVIAMEYIEGQTLDQVVDKNGPFSPQESARIIADILGTLDFAHSKGIFHRDIKPSNIMIDGSGRCKIIDFGIAKAETDPNLTIAGSSCGTPTYMAPEQFNPDEKIDYRLADIYAIGTTLYYLLTGKLPFKGDNAFALRDAKMFTDPQPPSKINSKVPKSLDKIVLKALKKEPSDRFLSATEMKTSLGQSGMIPESGQGADRTVEYPAAKPVKIGGKNRRSKYMLYGLSFLAAIAAIYFIYTWQDTDKVYTSSRLIKPYDGAELDIARPNFSWKSEDQNVQFRIEFGTSVDLADKQITGIISEMKYLSAIELGDGEYYWRVITLDEDDQNVAASEIWSFEIATLSDPEIVPQGNLIVAIDPSGDLYINGEKRWSNRSSGEITIDTGTHTVRARNSRSVQKSIDKSVTIQAGRDSRLDFRFSFPPLVAKVDSGSVIVGSRPILGGKISINGQKQNRATPNTFDLPVGKYEIGVKLDYKGQVMEKSATVFIVADSTKKIFIDFDK